MLLWKFIHAPCKRRRVETENFQRSTIKQISKKLFILTLSITDGPSTLINHLQGGLELLVNPPDFDNDLMADLGPDFKLATAKLMDEIKKNCVSSSTFSAG